MAQARLTSALSIDTGWGDKAWFAVWRTREVVHDKVEPESGLRLSDGPLNVLERLADYPHNTAFVEDISMEPLSW